MIKVSGLSYNLGKKTILKDVNFNLKQGRLMSILGMNGAGKSSLLKCLSGSIKDYSGEILFDGLNIKDFSLQEIAKKRSVLTQSVAVEFPFKVEEIVMMGRSPHENCSNKKNLEIANECLNIVDAENLKGRIFSSLSGGEQQRVQFARVLAQIFEQKNSILLFDEPTSALDLKYQQLFFEILQKMVREYSVSAVLILHDLNLAAKFCDDILLLKNGSVFEFGEAKQVLSQSNICKVFEIEEGFFAKNRIVFG